MTKPLAFILALALLPACSLFDSTLDQGDDLRLRPAVERIVERLRGYEGEAADSTAFLAAFDVREVDARAVWPLAAPVLDRHDAAVGADDSLSVIEKRTFLVTSENVRRTLIEAGAPP